MSEKILLNKNGAVAELIFNRPDRHNAYDLDMLDDLEDAFGNIRKDSAIRAVIIYGAGESAFSSGGDIDSIFQDLSPKKAAVFVRRIQDVFSMQEEIPAAVISAINGYCFGGGFEIALASDIRIASKSAYMGLPEVGVGILSGAGGTQRLMRYIGSRTVANEMLLTGKKLKADEALACGLVSSVYETNEELLLEARKLANKIAVTCSPSSIEAIKKCVLYGQNMDLTAGLRFEGEQWGMLFGTGDQIEGIKAFQERRKPNFPGRETY